VRIIEGPENRVIFLVMEQTRDELKYGSVKGRNPLKDLRVRQALYAAIDVEAIRSQVMRGQSAPTGSMCRRGYRAPLPWSARLLAYDPARARKLLAEAGFPQGFETQLTLPQQPLRERRAHLHRARGHVSRGSGQGLSRG